MYSGKMFFSTQSDAGAERYAGYFSHAIDAIVDGGAVAAAATAMKSSLSSSTSESEPAMEHVFVRWHNWMGMKNWSVCGHWSEGRGRIHDMRGMMIPQLAFLNYHVSWSLTSIDQNPRVESFSKYQRALTSIRRAALKSVATSTAAP
jgi:hypothetical protein